VSSSAPFIVRAAPGDQVEQRTVVDGDISSFSANHDTSCHVFLREFLMRADRLVSLVLLLRQRGRLSATELAKELEVSVRTVLRDIDALSTAGVPVYVDRGRNGGFSLLPGFRTELTGLNRDEALALLTAGGAGGKQVFGLGSALSSAMRKLIDALPANYQLAAADAAQRILVDPEADLLSRRRIIEIIPTAVMVEVRQAVLNGRKLRIHYAAENRHPAWREVDPIGLVTVREKGYLLATVDGGSDRTYRLSRILAAKELSQPAQRPSSVDLEELWQARSSRFRSGKTQLAVIARIDPLRREELADTALLIISETQDPDGWLRLELTFQDLRHAEWALWHIGPQAEALAPQVLRTALYERAMAVASRYT
jgi:predicted DNA-binding transcriptional regulator YafY